MANAYVQATKISNAVGRADYITDKKRQEEIVLSKESMTYTWEQHSTFEKDNQRSKDENNEAREIIVALPNQLYQTDKLEPFCDELVKQLVPADHDNQYAVHWNKTRTNLHVHILFSERANQFELEPKVYSRDMWYDKKTNKMAKAHADGAELRYKKGEIQREKDGNIKYKTAIFKAKDTQFKTREYTTKTIHEKTQQVFNTFGFEIDLQTKDSPYLSQKKLHKGASADYIEKASAWNEQVKKYNGDVKQHIELEPMQYGNYVEIKKELQTNVKEANAEEKKISVKSIELITDMANWVHQTLSQLKNYINRKAKEVDIMGKWEQTKDKFVEMFEAEKENQQEIISLKNSVSDLKNIEKDYQAVIDSKMDLIENLEEEQYLIDKLERLEPKAYRGYNQSEYENEIKGLSLEERVDQAEQMIKQMERSRSHGFER